MIIRVWWVRGIECWRVTGEGISVYLRSVRFEVPCTTRLRKDLQLHELPAEDNVVRAWMESQGRLVVHGDVGIIVPESNELPSP